MNRAQRVLILIGLLVIAAMGLYPPWLGQPSADSARFPAGYHLLFSPPQTVYAAPDWEFGWITMDTNRLAAQVLLVAAITAALVVALGWKKSHPTD